MAGTLVVDNITDGSGNTTTATTAIKGSAKAWVCFNGVTTATIRASFNVSSVTRNAVGDYTVSFTTAMSDANYATTSTVTRDLDTLGGWTVNYTTTTRVPTTTSARFLVGSITQNYDSQNISIAIFR